MPMANNIVDNTSQTDNFNMTLVKWTHGIPSQETSEAFNSYHAFLLVSQGYIEVLVDKKLMKMTVGEVADFIGKRQLKFISTSADLEAYFLSLDETAECFIFRKNPPFPLSYPITLRNNPITTIPANTMQQLSYYIERIRYLLTDEGHLFRSIALLCELMKFAVDLADYRIKNAKKESSLASSNRQENIFARFIELLEQNIFQERSVAFYANELCISPQYLAKVSRECSGQTVHDWISHMLLDKIIQFMNTQELTLVQIADKLNFSDQASFCKFFKKHINMSPTEFRKLK